MGYIWGFSLHLWWMKTAVDCPRWLTKLLMIILRAVKEVGEWEYTSVLYFWIYLICYCSLVIQKKGRLCSTRILFVFSSQACGTGSRAESSGTAELLSLVSLVLWAGSVLTLGCVCVCVCLFGCLYPIRKCWYRSSFDQKGVAFFKLGIRSGSCLSK